MAQDDGGAPPWLFSFVDLAFLLLIAMTQLAADPSDDLDLGDIIVPRIRQESTGELPTGASQVWQLRVHPPDDFGTPPFELLGPEQTEGSPLDVEALREGLLVLQQTSEEKPLLAPHEDSRSQDLLDAVALIEELWPGRRRATVASLPSLQ